MISIIFFQLTKEAQEQKTLRSLINIIQESIKEFAELLEKNIKVFGSIDDPTNPRILQLDLIVNKPYLREYTIFAIRLNTSKFEIVTQQKTYIVDNYNEISKIISDIVFMYDYKNIK